MPALLSGRETFNARALFLGHRINLRGVDAARRIAPSPLMMEAGARGAAVLFRWGAVVLFGLDQEEESSFVAGLRPLVAAPYPEPESEELEIRLDAAEEACCSEGILRLQSAGVDRLQIVAEVLARSVVLAHYETSIADVFDEVEPLADALSATGRSRIRGKALLRHIGRTLDIEHRMVGRAEIEEKPEALWEHPELELLYQRLAEEYELRDRHRALEHKLELISRTASTLLTMQYNRRSLRVEWYIVALILIEILIYLYEIATR